MFKVEIYRAFRNKAFWISMATVITIVILHVVFFVIPQSRYLDIYMQDPMMCPHSLYVKWLGTDFGCVLTTVLYWIFPLAAIFPFGASFFGDRQTGYIKCLLTRGTRCQYLGAKLLAIFLSSAVIVFVPLVLDLLLTAAWIPAIFPQPTTYTFAISSQNMWSEIYFTYPMLYVFMYIVLDTVFIATTATCAIAFSHCFSSILEVLILPLSVYIISYFVCSWIRIPCFAPLCFLTPYQPVSNIHFEFIIFEEIVMLCIILAFYFWERKNDLSI